MRLLEAEGLVTFERGKGMFVTRGLSREEAVVIYRCRRVIEPYLTRCATERMTPEKLRAIREILDRFAAAVLNQTPESELSRIDAEFHDAIYRTSESDLVNIFHSYWGRRRELSARVYKNESPSLFLREHEEIYEALAAGDGPTAAERMERHIAHGQRVMEELTFVAAAPPSSQAQATLTQ